jgi:hypothetical protein
VKLPQAPESPGSCELYQWSAETRGHLLEYNNRALNLASVLGLTSFEGIRLPASAVFVADSVKNAGIGGSYQIGRVQLHALFTQVRIENRGPRDIYRALASGADFRLMVADGIDAGIWTTTFAGKRSDRIVHESLGCEDSTGPNTPTGKASMTAAMTFSSPSRRIFSRYEMQFIRRSEVVN